MKKVVCGRWPVAGHIDRGLRPRSPSLTTNHWPLLSRIMDPKGGPMSRTPTREEAWQLLKEYTPSDALRRHGLAVEAVMRHLAKKHGQDEEMWGVIGLVHDLD